MTALANHHLDTKARLPESHRSVQHVHEDLAAGRDSSWRRRSCCTRCGHSSRPGLYRNERRYVLPFMFSTVGLFLAGGYFGYRMVYPAALDFLIGFSGQFKPMITVGEYTELFLTIIAGLGIVFEMPILVFFLALMGILSAGLDVAQLPIRHSGHLHHLRHHHPDARHHEHVHLRRSHDRALFDSASGSPGSCTRRSARSGPQKASRQVSNSQLPTPSAPSCDTISSTAVQRSSLDRRSNCMSTLPNSEPLDQTPEAFPYSDGGAD